MASVTELRRRAERTVGLHKVRRPITSDAGHDFDLTYVRRSSRLPRRGRAPVVILPGGPGLASVVPYADLRARAARRGLDVLMPEHRGVGLSRRDDSGDDLPLEAMRLEYVVADLEAVLDDAGIERATIVGSSYGTYPAQAFAVTHPDRVEALVLDSTTLSTDDEEVTREYARDLLYRGRVGTQRTRRLASTVRRLVERGTVEPVEFGHSVQAVYEQGGAELLERFLGLVERGAAGRTRAMLRRAVATDLTQVVPLIMEPDLVGEIAFAQLAYDDGDGGIFDPGTVFAGIRDRYSPFAGEPYDLAAELPGLEVPVTVLSGDRDLTTPRPIARRVATLAPRGRLISLRDQGHGALDTHSEALLATVEAVADRRDHQVDANVLGDLPRRGGLTRHAGTVLGMSMRVDELLRRDR